MQTQSGPGQPGIRGTEAQENPAMMASIDEGEQSRDFFTAQEKDLSRQESFAFESSGNSSQKMSFAPQGMSFPKGTIGASGSIAGIRVSMADSDHSKRMSQYSKNLQGFGAYSQNQIQLGMSERDRKKEMQRRETNKYKNRKALDELQDTEGSVCFSCFDCV